MARNNPQMDTAWRPPPGGDPRDLPGRDTEQPPGPVGPLPRIEQAADPTQQQQGEPLAVHDGLVHSDGGGSRGVGKPFPGYEGREGRWAARTLWDSPFFLYGLDHLGYTLWR